MNNVSDRKNRPNAFADRIAGFDDPSMGDERERDIILRAYTFGAVVSTYVFFALALVFAVLGAGMWSVLIVFGSMVTSIAVSAYCQRENVDFSMAMARVSPRRLIVGNIVGALFAIAWVGAIVFQLSNGYPLIDAGMGNRTMPGAPLQHLLHRDRRSVRLHHRADPHDDLPGAQDQAGPRRGGRRSLHRGRGLISPRQRSPGRLRVPA